MEEGSSRRSFIAGTDAPSPMAASAWEAWASPRRSPSISIAMASSRASPFRPVTMPV